MARFSDIAFTPHVRSLQEQHGSRKAYAAQEARSANSEDNIGTEEMAFIESRDSFYMATVTETDWPYIQHRGGPKGFLRVIDPKTLGFADLGGNRQYISLGNLETNNRAALFLMDYPTKTRLKILAYARVVEREADPELVDSLAVKGYSPKVERAMIFDVQGVSWNCQQHINSRFTFEEIIQYGICGSMGESEETKG